MQKIEPYYPKNHVRIVTAASLFDGHDAAINIMRRILQASGAEVIHLGHDRSVQEVVNCAVQEDAQAIAMTSYQGGHMEYFKYMHDLLKEKNAAQIKIFGGGGGVILPGEIEELQQYGITRIYSPDDGRAMGLQGMINDLLKQSDFPAGKDLNGEWKSAEKKDYAAIARLISAAENFPEESKTILDIVRNDAKKSKSPVLGITGTGGAGKSSLVDELIRRFLNDFKDRYVGIISVDPSKRKTGGALLGDRIRMNAINNDRVYMRSLATRQSNLALSKYVADALSILKSAKFDLIILETAGIGQSDTEISDFANVSLYVMTPEYGAASQLEKIDMLDFADIIALNKFDKRGALDALRDVKKQYKRNHQLFEKKDDELPVFGTIASQFNDPGMNQLYRAIMEKISEKTSVDLHSHLQAGREMSEKVFIIPAARTRYLSEISENNRKYDERTNEQSAVATKLFGLYQTISLLDAEVISYSLAESEQKLDAFLKGGELREQKVLTLEKGKLEGDEITNYSGRYSEKIFTHPNLKTFRRELRNHSTPAEAKLWSLINNRQLLGRKFRRQHSIGPYIVDFYYPEQKLAIELDGDGHYQAAGALYDEERTEFLRTYGIKVIRFENQDVFERTDAVLEEIKRNLTPPAPSLKEGEHVPTKVLSTERGEQETKVLPLEKGELEGDEIKKLEGVLIQKFFELKKKLDPNFFDLILGWKEKTQRYHEDIFTYKVRGKDVKVKTFHESLSHLKIPRVATPRFESWGKIVQWSAQENFPGEFPYTAGIYPFKREGEDPTRMFAGEGGPERTNKRFHYVSLAMPAKRLSTAFDSVTLYGRDPDYRPDIYGKIGNAGVSICCLDDAKKLYSGFNLCDPKTSVSMTINGPASIITAFFMNAAIDQQCEIFIKQNNLVDEVRKKIESYFNLKNTKQPTYQGDLPEGNDGLGLMLLGITGDQVLEKETYNKIKAETLKQVRGTVQADILKEDQAQNTCIFSTEFSLRLMGDMQEYFIGNKVRNFYSVSISGYHIAEAGANPISQLAFTLANGFTYVEYYLSRGMKIDDFAPNLSFFFSNGIDAEYAVIGRVARRIWAKAMKYKYGANERSQMLKYHIQTSGRSLHAQEIDFNDIRTTLQALYAIYDNCNSLHTNAYDEAITTPTEESVRRAMAIQLIINRELGLAKNENPLQGSFIIEELTDLVEEAVLAEFDRINERGGVLGAMETMYQRGKIQEESLYYETLKNNGEYPIIGVNTFLSSKGSPTILPKEVIRSTKEEKEYQIEMLEKLHKRNEDVSPKMLDQLQTTAIQNKNMFSSLMEVSKYCSLGQITNALFDVGGQYRRNM